MPSLFSWTFAAAILHAATAQFTPGTVCNGISHGTAVSDLLRGKHLRVLELDWFPFGTRHAATGDWRGYDIGLLQRVSGMLGFTYEIHSLRLPTGSETWNNVLSHEAVASDLILSYWTHDTTRYGDANISMLPGHVDASVVLLGRSGEYIAEQWQRQLWLLVTPFDFWVWLSIPVIILLSGLVDYLIEVRHHPVDEPTASLMLASLFNYARAFVNFGFDAHPKTRASAAYHLFVGIIVLALTAAYTAHLAAVLTVSATTSWKSVTSMSDAIAREERLCAGPQFDEDRDEGRILRRFYPGAQVDAAAPSGGIKSVDRLFARECAGVIASMAEYRLWNSQHQYCNLELTQQLWSQSAGWVTNRASPCVRDAISYALQTLQSEGEVQFLYNELLRNAQCYDTTPQPVSQRPGPAARRLDESSASAESGVSSRARRLAVRGGGDTSSSPDGLVPLGLLQFSGLFGAWLVASVGLLLFVYVAPKKVKEQRKRAHEVQKERRKPENAATLRDIGQLLVAMEGKLVERIDKASAKRQDEMHDDLLNGFRTALTEHEVIRGHAKLQRRQSSGRLPVKPAPDEPTAAHTTGRSLLRQETSTDLHDFSPEVEAQSIAAELQRFGSTVSSQTLAGQKKLLAEYTASAKTPR